MDRKEMEAKLLKHGLPQWGTDDELKVRLIRNNIISSSKIQTIKELAKQEVDEMSDEDIKRLSEEQPRPRKMGRPKKVK